MSELSTNHTNIETSLFNTISNEHTLFAGTLRDWCDPLLQGQQRIQVPLCPRCVTCKCESLKDFPDSLNNRNHRQHHDPSCPKYHQHKRIKTTSRRRPFNKPKRRANSYDSSIILDNQKRSLIKQDNEHSLSHISTHQHIERKQSISRIPVRISSSTTTTTTTTSSSNVTTTTTSEYSPASSINSNRSLNMNTKIPRPISNQNSSHTTFFTYTNKNLSTSDEDSHDYDHDSLQDDTCQTQLTMSNNEFYNKDISSKKKKKNIMMLYCTTNGTNQLDNVDEQTKKKKKMSSSSSKTHNHSESSSDKRQRKFWHKEGRHSKSKATGTLSSPINDLSSTISSSSSSSSTTSSYSNNCSSSIELKKKSRPYRLASPSRIATTTTTAPQYPSLSDDSLSEKSEQLFQNQYLNSIYEPKKDSSSHLETLSGSSAIKSPSVYLIELKNSNRPINSFGLTKTITYVWKSSYSKKFDNDLNHYPKYSVEQVPPIIDHNKRLIPISSRHIMLQRSKIDYWQNMETTTDSILASSCQNHIGSATNLLIPTLDNQTNDITQTTNSNGHIISITTTQHRQPSLLNQCQNTQWNIEGDGKQLRYSNLKWYSADQLQKDNRLITKQRTQQQQQQQTSDSTTDTGSSSEQHNRSAPPILQRTTNTHLHEVFETISMNKQNDSNLPDYTIFNREINNTSSPIQKNTSTSSSSSSSSPSKNKIQSYEKILNKPSTCSPKRKLNSYASTDEDVDEFNLDCSDHIDRSLTTIQTYRDKLNARLQAEQSDTNSTRRRITSMEYSQNTIDSGVDILSEQKLLQSKIDEQYSEETTNQNDLFALSDDSLLDIESPQINDLSLKPISIINEKSISLTEESNEGKSFLTAITDFPLIITSERGPSNTSEHYYSAESEFNTSLSFQNNDTSNINEYENNNTNNNDHNEINNPNLEIQQISSEYSQTNTIDMNVKISTFGDWIDQVFTTFLAETNQQQSSSTSRSSSIISIHTSTNTIDTSSSQVLTVIENNKNNETLTIISKNSIKTDNNNQMNFLHCRSQSWPSNEQQQQDEKNFKELSNSSLSNENIDLNSYENVSNNENINSINEQDVNKQSTSMQLSSIENNDEEVINKETMQNNYLHHHTTSSTTPSNTDQIHIDDENFSFSNLTTTTTNNIIDDVGTVEETEHIDDEKQTEIGVDDDNKNDSPLIQVVIPDESSSFSFDEEFLYCQTPQNQHTNSHDSLLQADHHIMNNINTAASSTDDLSSTNQLSLSAFHSKDSALGLSDDNLNWIQTKQSIIRNNHDHDDDDDIDDEQQEQQISLSSLSVQYDKTVDNNEIQDNANNNNIDKNEMLCEHNNDDENVPKNTSTMICINDQSQIIKPSNLTEHVERTISSSSSEQLIPKEKQTGMYYPAFGSSAAIHLAEKYHCEWLQDVTSPTNTIRKSSTIINDNKEASDSRIFHQNQTIGDDDEFYLSLQTLQPSYSCPNINTLTIRETQRQRSYSLTTLDAYAYLDITRDTLEQMWLSLLDLAFSDKDDVELGEYKLRHIIGLSNSCTHNTLLEKSRSHGDIFSTTNENPQEKFIKKKSKSFDITSLPKLSTLTTTGTGIEKTKNDSANIGLLQGAAISEPFIDRIGPISSIQSDTENNLMDIDNDSIQSNEQDNHLTDEPYSPIIINQITSPVIKEPLNYIFHFTQQLENQNHNNNDDEYDLEPMNDISSYLPNINLPINQIFGDEDKQLCMSLGFDDDEATAALAAAVVQPRDIQAILADYRPHSLSTIPSSRESQYASSIDDSDDIIDLHDNIKNTIGINQENILQVDNTEDEEEEEDDKGEIESNISSSPSKPLSPIHSRSSTPSERNQQLQPSNFSDIDHDAWERSINEPIYSNDLSIKHNNNDEENLFTTYTDNLTSIVSIPSLEQSQLFTIDEIEPTIIVNESEENNFIEQTTTITTATTININNNLINFSIHEDYIENMDNNQYENKSTNSTRTSISSIHDTHLDPNELAYRLARLDSSNISSPPKKTLADELAELGERENHFENDSLDHTPPLEQESNEQNENLLSLSSLNIDQLTTIVNDIQKINQEKSISSLCTIIEDIHAEKNNQYLTKIVDYHHSPPISNLQTIIMELNQISMKKLLSRPQRPTHLELDIEEDIPEYDEQSLSPMIIDNNIPISSNLISNLEQNLAEYKIKSPSPSPPSPPVISPPPPPPLLPPSSSMTRRISDILPVHSNRYQTHRIDKVSDLEIVKQGKGFKIGYVDRQGTDQRVILTKRIQAGPDIMARDPHVRLPYKGRKILNQAFSSILYTNGYNTIQEDKKFERTSDDIEVPIIGTNPQHFDESDMVSIDIDGPSTMLNSICESIVITQGSVYTNNSLKSSQEKPLNQSITRNIFDNTNNNFNSTSSSRLRHVVLDQHEEYLLDTSHTPTPTNKKDKIEIIDTWQDHTIIDGSSTTWRSPSLHAYKATKHIEPSNQVQTFISTIEPNLVQMRIAPSHDIKYRTSEHIEIPSDYNWNDESSATPTPIKHTPKTTRDMALSPILIDNKTYKTSSTSPIGQHQEKIDRSCQYSPPIQHDFGLQCYVNNSTTSTQVSSYEIPNFLLTYDGIQTIHDINQTFDDSGIQTHIQTISPSLSIASSDHQQSIHTGKDFIRKLNDSNNNNHASALTITQYTDDHYYLPTSDNNNNNNNQTIMNTRLTTLERSADSGILVDEQLLRNRRNKANFALQVDIKGSSSDSEDVSEVTRRPFNRIKSSINDDMYEHHSELIITAPNSNKNRQHSSINNKHLEQSIKSAKEIEQQILQLRRERAHILELLSLNWSRSNIWVELTEAKLNYIIGETDALLRSLSFDTNPIDSERVKLIMHQYEEDMAELTRQRLAVYRERLENSKKQLDMKIDELELKKSTLEQNTSHYSTLEYMPRVDNVKHSKSFLSTSAENLSNMPLQDSISSHPHLLDISFLTSTPSNQTIGLPPRYPRSPRLPQQYQSSDTYRTVYRPTPRYPSTITTSNDQRYDYPRYRTTSYVTPNGNLSGLQGLSKSQQAILDETDKLVKDSQELHNESASQFERARESLLSSEASIRLARANMAASRYSPNSNYLPNDVTLAELFKYEQSLAKETAKNTRAYSSLSTSAES